MSIGATLLLIPISKYLPEVFSSDSISGLFRISLYIIAVYFFRGLFSFIQNYLSGIFSIKSTSDLKKDIYSLLLKSKPETFYSKKTGEYITVITDDINKIREMSFSVLTELLPSVITLCFTLGYIFYLNWKLSLFVLLLIPVIGGVIAFFSQKIREKAESIQNKLVNNHSILHEVFINYPAIKIFSLENKKNNDFVELENYNNKDNLDIIKLIALQPSVIGVIQVIGICIIACFGGYQLFNKTLTLAELLSFGTALSLTIEPVIFITKSLGIINKSVTSIDNSIKLKNFLKANQDNKSRLIKEIEEYTITFKNLGFSYDKQKVFDNLNLTIKHGQIIALSGDNGCGKSTLIKLFLQLLDNFSGEIKLGNHDIAEYDLDIFRKNIKACFSEPFIFNGTIRENIVLENDVSFAELEKVIQTTKLDEIIDNTKNGLDYYINNSGNNLSSGQKQRIALARAIISKPEVLILDEATSNLDLEAEKYIYKAIREYLPASTIIIINHRKQSIGFVDQLFLLENITLKAN